MMQKQGGWLLLAMAGGGASSVKVMGTREEAVEAARLVAKGLGAKGWVALKLAPGCVLFHGGEGGGWGCLICPAAPVAVAAPKPKGVGRAAAAQKRAPGPGAPAATQTGH